MHLLKLLFLILFSFSLMAKNKVLIVVTSHDKMGTSETETGYFLSEVSHPYMVFHEAKIPVDIVSIKGGEAPADPKSLDFKDKKNEIFFNRLNGKDLLANTKKLSDVNIKDYKAIVYAGGHGTMWDFPNDPSVLKKTAELYEAGGVVAAVCHGPAALVNIKLSNGKYLVDGKNVTAFTNAEEDAIDLSKYMPFMLETKLKQRGAKFSNSALWQKKVVTDGRLVTGQNPASADGLAQEVLKLIKN